MMENQQDNERIFVNLEFTPNPNTLKYSVNRVLLQRGSLNMESLEDAKSQSPLAAKIFEIPGITHVFVGRDFVTISKNDSAEWEDVHEACLSTIESQLNSSSDLSSVILTSEARAKLDGGTQDLGEIETKIVSILEQEIRPAVAMDGGDILFDRYESGVVYVHLQGSCQGCPSATQTLKMGVEERLKRDIPEVTEVIAVN